ncbi:hypothetical protein CCAX7_55410 [Capsulimonas corticalis]|uniref:Uncharacterized protein n=1 Tax=Capsulimonas corticalis TaxID=2219043 RepID=A0A402D0U6_9BACT|nr:LamG-like jellyroll fold domain-containing protein [Capsulimonas corticalis]BDI33490.1 hypothetical protein CCAX7_55410 [Capsulimonas corticalis]
MIEKSTLSRVQKLSFTLTLGVLTYTPQSAFAVTPTASHDYEFHGEGSGGSFADTASAPAITDNGVAVGGAYIPLENNILITNGAVGAGGKLPQDVFVTGFYTGSFSISEVFAYQNTTTAFQTLFSFSTDTAHYLIAHPFRGDTGKLSVDFNNGGGEVSLQANAPLSNNNVRLTVTYDASTTQATLYVNGVLSAQHAVPGGFNISAIAGPNYSGVAGLSPYGDPSLIGYTNSFRIFNTALTASQIP